MEHAHLHPEAGEYWRRTNQKAAYLFSATQQFKQLICDNRPIPEWLWKQCAACIGLDPDNQPERMKVKPAYTQEDLDNLNKHIKDIANQANKEAAESNPLPMRRPAGVIGARTSE